MAGVATDGSKIIDSIKSGHVTYRIETYQCVSWGPFGCTGYGWVPSGSGSTNAKISGQVTVPSSKMKLLGKNVAKVGDHTSETWVADPPIPSSSGNTRYIATSPTSGSGQGTISSGSAKGKLEGQAIALIGSQVTTCLGTTTTIADGDIKMKFGS